jgi:hypothetical protein
MGSHDLLVRAYRPAAAKWLLLLLEAVAMISNAAILLALFCGGSRARPTG